MLRTEPKNPDDQAESAILELVDGLRRTHGLTVLSTMHDLTLAGRFADRFALLSQGRLVSTGTRTDVLNAAVIAEHFGASVRVIGDADIGYALATCATPGALRPS